MIYLERIDCAGDEDTLLECPTEVDLGCDHSRDAGIRCSGMWLCNNATKHNLHALMRTRFERLSTYFELLTTDTNQCSLANGGCDQNCTDIIPGRECSCGIGYLLDNNGQLCNGK